MSNICEFCELPLPLGCGHIGGEYIECRVGPRRDPEWIVGMAVWKDLMDRRGVKRELEACETAIKVGIIETIGHKAIDTYTKLKLGHLCGTPLDKDNYTYGSEWACPICGEVWTLTVDEAGEASAYWDKN